MNAILPALVNGGILSALVTAVLWLALRLVPGRVLNAATRYVVWWAALAVAITLPVLYLQAPAPLPEIPPAPRDGVVAGGSDFTILLPEAAPMDVPGTEAPSGVRPLGSEPPQPEASPAWPKFPIEIPAGRWPQRILGFWLLASAIMLVRLVVSWTLLMRCCSRGLDPPTALQARAARWLGLFGSRRRVRLAYSKEIAIPAAVGPLRPTVLIPTRLLGEMDESALEQIGLHEAAHLARRDDYALAVQRILEAVFALHPVVRWITRRIDLEREIACDDLVLAATGQSRSYASCLTRMVELSAGVRDSPATATISSHLVRRVETLLDKTRHTGTRLLRARLAAVIVALALLVWVGGRFPGLLAFATPPGLPAALGALLPQLAAPLMTVQSAAQQPAPSPTAKPEELCSVKGRVVNAETGEPLRKATILFRSSGPGGASRTSTDEAGEFEAVALDPGVYNVSAMRSGFLSAQYGAQKPGQSGTPLTLSPGQKLSGVDFKMTPQGVITGRVVNREGEPMAVYAVFAYQVRYLGGRRALRSADATRTNDLGEYRLSGMSPGSYYILVERARQSESEAGQDRSARPRLEDYVTTYYPGATDLRGAVPVEVGSGQTVEGINVALTRTRVTRVRGRVINQTGETGIPISVSLNSPERPESSVDSTRAGPQGEFEFRGVAPGSYSLEAAVWIAPRRWYRAQQLLEVREDPVENLSIQLIKGHEIPGNVKVEGDEKLDLRSLVVGLRTPWYVTIAYTVTPGTPDERGDFRVTGASPDHYIVYVDNMPDGSYIKSARMGEVDALEQGVDLTRGASGPLEVVLSGKAAGISGTVKDVKDKPVVDATVALVPREAGRQGQQPFYLTARTDRSGNFTMRNLIPGEYKLYSWAEVVAGAWVDPEFLKPLDSKATAVTLREGSSQAVELKVISAGR